MAITLKMGTHLFHGTPAQRVSAAGTLVMWIAIGGFVTSTLAYYVDPLVSVDLSGKAPGLIGSFVTGVGALFFEAV